MWTFVQSGLTLLGLGGYAVIGVMVALGYFRKNDTRRKDSDEIADTLISRLQERVKQIEDDTKNATEKRDKQISILTSQVDHLSGRNAVLEDLFKGRDPAMQTFLKDAPSLIAIARENNGLAKEMSQGLSTLETSLAKFVDTLSPILINLEMAKPPKQAVQ